MVDVKKLVEKHGVMKLPNVIGYSNVLQWKIKGGRVLPIKSIRIYVTRKLPREKLRKDELIPEDLDGIPTDVVEIGRLRAVAVYAQRYRPAPCGVSTSRLDESAAGTIGWWLVDEDGQIYLISNNHVWAKENQGQQGDQIVQPGVLDGGTEDDVIAELYDFVPLDFTSTGVNYVDVAVATPVDMSKLYTSIMELGGVTGKRGPSQGEQVCKVGRTTGRTCGEVVDASATVQVDYASGTATFEDVFLVQGTELVNGGDSGSPVLSSDNKFLGLLFAGNDDGSLFVACKQSRIESALQNRLGKKIWVLVANSWPPFQKEIEVQKVYPSSLEVMAMSLNMMMQLLLSLSLIAQVNVIASEWVTS